jgi:hypothetical protein
MVSKFWLDEWEQKRGIIKMVRTLEHYIFFFMILLWDLYLSLPSWRRHIETHLSVMYGITLRKHHTRFMVQAYYSLFKCLTCGSEVFLGDWYLWLWLLFMNHSDFAGLYRILIINIHVKRIGSITQHCNSIKIRFIFKE